MITAKIDVPKLEKSLKQAARRFGDTTAQAVTRWGVQVCRELAVSTQVFGKTKTKDKQIKSIYAGAYSVLHVHDSGRAGRGDRWLHSPEEVNEWIDSNRGKKGRTKKLPIQDRKEVTRAVFEKAMKIRAIKAGIPKGGWIGAGQDIARAQTGAQRITIGKNWLGYAQKHSKMGDGKPAKSGFFPYATLHNKAAHSSSEHVLSKSQKDKAVAWGLKKTLTWYRSAIRKSLDKT